MGSLIAMGAGYIIDFILLGVCSHLADNDRTSTLKWYGVANFVAAVAALIAVHFFSSRSIEDPVSAFGMALFLGCITAAVGSFHAFARRNHH